MLETSVSKVNHHFSPSQPSSSVVVDLIGGEVEEEVGGWVEAERWSLERRRGEIVPDSEMEFTSARAEAKFVDLRPNGWMGIRVCVKTFSNKKLPNAIQQAMQTHF